VDTSETVILKGVASVFQN